MKTEHLNQKSKTFIKQQHGIAILCWHEHWISNKEIATLLELCHDEASLHRFCQTRRLYKKFTELNEAYKRGQLLIEAYAQQGITILFSNDENYPPQMRALAPSKPILSVSGNPDLLKYAQIAIVGSRNLTHSAITPTERLAQELIHRGFILTSGGAIGIDAIAHRTAMQVNQPSIIVTATSLDRIYPKENRDIFEYCKLNGAVVSHSPISTAPARRLFPTRNATIAGLAQATIIAQAGPSSGALYTAKACFSLNRPVYVLSMPAFDETCLGGLKLLSDHKAKCLNTIDDLNIMTESLTQNVTHKSLFNSLSKHKLNSFNAPFFKDSTKQNAQNSCLTKTPPISNDKNNSPTSNIHQIILEKVQSLSPTREVLRASLKDISYEQFNSAILDLELDGSIVYNAGRFYIKA